MPPRPNKAVIVTAPSGAGKTSITRHLLQQLPTLAFSVSATTREKRGAEVDGKDYHFIDLASFQLHIRQHDFLEWEMVYEGKYYGTLMPHVQEIWQKGHTPLLDIDVQGALRVMKDDRVQALSLFIDPPSLEELERRLRARGTDPEASIRARLDKAATELSFKERFDHIIVNDDLPSACQMAEAIVRAFLDA